MTAMSLFSRKQPGWMAVCIYSDRVDLVHVCRFDGAQPQVRSVHSYAHAGSERDALARLGRTHRLSHYQCVTLLAAGEYQLLQVDAPAVPPAELKDALRWRVKDQLDYPIEGALIDALTIPCDRAPTARTPQAFAVAALKTTVGARVKPFHDGKVALDVVDIPELAQRNVAALLEDENRGLALLAFDAAGGLLTFTYGGDLYAFRHIDSTADQLSGADDARREQLGERISLELQRSFDNFDRQFNFISLKRLLLAEVPGAPWLLPYLAKNSYVPTEAMDLSTVMDFAAVPELRQPLRQAQCLQALGAALRPNGVAT